MLTDRYSDQMLRGSGLAHTALLATTVASVMLRANPIEDRSLQLQIRLTTTPNLPETARLSMMDESAAIWRKHGVRIEWLPATSVDKRSPHHLRVLVVEQRSQGLPAGDALAVGELLRTEEGHSLALMSVAAAQRLVSSVRGRAGYDLVAVDHRRLGLVLGRALAHEIGHYLLNTHSHARQGLMRPQFDALEFTDLRDGTFVLDDVASGWLRSHFGLAETTVTRPTSDRFAYAR